MARSIIDTERITAAAGDLKRNSESIEASVREMRTRLASLSGAWEGPAAVQFGSLIQEWEALQARVTQCLQNVSQMTTKAATAYQQNEDATRAMFAH